MGPGAPPPEAEDLPTESGELREEGERSTEGAAHSTLDQLAVQPQLTPEVPSQVRAVPEPMLPMQRELGVTDQAQPTIAREIVERHRPARPRVTPPSMPLARPAAIQRKEQEPSPVQAGVDLIEEVPWAQGPIPFQEASVSDGPFPAGRADSAPSVHKEEGEPSSAPLPGTILVQRSVRTPQDLRRVLQPSLKPMAVQTATAETESSSQQQAPAAGVESAPEEGATQSEEDIESLAQEVYRIIRRRLAVESERERGRS